MIFKKKKKKEWFLKDAAWRYDKIADIKEDANSRIEDIQYVQTE